MLGHAVGQYAAACAAGVFTLTDGLSLAVRRGAWLESAVLETSARSATLEAFEATARNIDYHPAQRTVICSLTGEETAGETLLDAAYWRRHLQESTQWA